MDNSGFMALSNAIGGLASQVQTNFNAVAQMFEADQEFQVTVFKEFDKINNTLKQIIDKIGVPPIGKEKSAEIDHVEVDIKPLKTTKKINKI